MLVTREDYRLAPGVVGLVREHGGANYIEVIQADHEGDGDVGRYLDGLDLTQKWKVSTVVSDRLRGMLVRRGWRRTIEGGEEVFVRPPSFTGLHRE